MEMLLFICVPPLFKKRIATLNLMKFSYVIMSEAIQNVGNVYLFLKKEKMVQNWEM